ncbi:MAG: pitrilysin family protein [Chloroflexi bacterium]|nr:pitrilysin family protein [Chloroflexota bacterium]
MPSADAIRPEISTLDNGLRVVTTSIPTAQSASTAFFVGVGSRGEDRRTNGVSHYLEHMLFKGTERRPTAPEISQAIEGAGGSLNAYTTRELTCYWNNLPFERAETGIEVVADMLQHSLLAAEEIDRERTVVQQEIRRGHDTPAQRAGELMVQAVYGDQPIGWPVTGSLETVGALQREDFTSHVERFYTAHNSVLSVAGNVEHDWVVETAARHFEDLRGGDPETQVAAEHGPPEESVIVEERDIEQTNLALSVQALARRDPQRYALELLHTVLGRGMSSRLFKEVRERRGLAYSVGSRIARHRDIGMFSVTAGVTADHQEEALEVILRELEQAAREPVSEDELRRALDFATGTFRLGLETPMSLGQRFGDQLLQDGELELPTDTVARMQAVTAEEIQEVAVRIFAERAYALAVVGPSASPGRLESLLAA